MTTFSNCLKIVNAMHQKDQDALLARLDELQAKGLSPKEAQLQAAIDVLTQVRNEGWDGKSAESITDTPAFKRWFGDSKVVDADGKPMVMYHSTESDFDTFDTNRRSVGGAGSWFTSKAIGQSGYGEGENVMPVYLSLQNPKMIDTSRESGDVFKQKFIDQGYDGVVMKGDGPVVTAVAFHPDQIKSAIGNNGEFNPNEPNILKSPERPVFYSQLQRSIEQVPERLSTMTATAWKQWLTGNASKLGIKAEEIEWSGIKDFLDLQGKAKLSKDDLAAYLDDSGVKVGETVLGGERPANNSTATKTALDAEAHRQFGYEYDGLTYNERNSVRNVVESSAAKYIEPSYDKYTLPGGENYREVLITLPEKAVAEGGIPAGYKLIDTADEDRADGLGIPADVTGPWRFEGPGVSSRIYKTRDEALAALLQEAKSEEKNGIGAAGRYRSSHWNEPNVLAHIRVNDRTDADGKRVLFVEEVQSDWGQEGKKKGFNGKDPLAKNADGDWIYTRPDGVEVNFGPNINEQMMRQGMGGKAGSVPAAPFVTKTEGWLNLALKRIAMMAVEGGYDKVAFINGEQSADRYDLSKQIEWIAYGGGVLQAYDKSRTQVVDEHNVPPEKLADYVGKEVAEKLLAQPKQYGKHLLENQDLKIGGEGMKTFYDKIVPQAVNKLLPKLGGEKLDDVTIGGNNKVRKVRDDDGTYALEEKKFDEYDEPYWEPFAFGLTEKRAAEVMQEDRRLKQPGFTITDKMREAIGAGVPLFSPERMTDEELSNKSDKPWFDDLKDLKVGTNYKLSDLLKTSKKLSWWSRTVGTQYDLAQRHPQFKRVFDAVQNFINDVSYYATLAADMAPNILPKLDSLKDIGKSPLSAEDVKALRDPIFGGTLKYTRDDEGNIVETNDVDKAGVVFTNEELRDKFKLNAKQIELYREFRKAVNKSMSDLAVSDMLRYMGKDGDEVRQKVLDATTLDGAVNAITAHLDKLIAQQPERAASLEEDKKVIKEKAGQAIGMMARGYAPLSRFGQYTVYVVGKDGEQLYFSMFENERDANKMADEMRDQYPDAKVTQGTMSQESYKLFSGVTPETLALFGESLGLEESGIDPKSEVFQQYLKMAKTNRSAMKRMIERKGISGFNEDVGRVLAGFVYSNARQTSTNLHAGDISRGVQAIDQRDGDIKDAAVRLMEYVQNPREEAQALRGLMFTNFIGGSIASAMVNMTQPFTMTLPYLSQFDGIAGASRRMADAVKLVSRGIRNDEHLKAALEHAEKEGIVSPQEVHQLMAQANGKGALQTGDGTKAGNAAAKVNNGMAKLGLAWGKVFSAAEQFNRRVTFIAAYKLARDQKMADPMAFAKQAIEETQGVYNKGNKPTWARGAVGATLFTFKQYSIGYIEFLRRMWGNGPEGKKAVGLALAVLFLMSGFGGMPFSDDLDDVIDGFMQRVLNRSFDTKQAKKEFFASILGQSGAEFVMSGLSGLPGVPIDVSGRMGLGNLVPGTGLFTKKRDYGSDYMELLGPAGTMFTNAGSATANIAKGEFGAAVTSVLPQAAQNFAKALDMAQMGYYRDAKGRKVVDTDMWDAVAKGIGFQPKAVAQVQEATGTQANFITQNKLREGEIVDKWTQGRIERDQSKVDEAKQELADWNKSNPDSPIKIDVSQINKRVVEANKSKAQRIAATAPKEIRGSVKKQLEHID
jgi:hypothetical protein